MKKTNEIKIITENKLWKLFDTEDKELIIGGYLTITWERENGKNVLRVVDAGRSNNTFYLRHSELAVKHINRIIKRGDMREIDKLYNYVPEWKTGNN